MWIYKFLSAFIFIFFSLNVFCQQPLPNADTTAKKQIHILQAQRLKFQKLNDTTELQSLSGNVVVQQQTTLFYCDSAVLNKHSNILEAFGHVHINSNDSINTYADYLKYLGNQKIAYLNKNVVLTDGKGTLTTPALEYNLQTKQGTYLTGGKLTDNQTTLTSTEGYYFGETKDVYFKKNVVMVNPDYTVKTDTLLYNTYTNIARWEVPTEIVSGKRKINTVEGYYDMNSKKAFFSKRPVIHDSSGILIADEIAFDDSTHFGEYQGNVIYKDTAQGFALLSNNLKTNGNQNSFLATESPVMILKQDKDSVFIASDTMYSGRITDLRKQRTIPEINFRQKDSSISSNIKIDSAHDRFIEAYYHVKIFSDSMQAAGDSMFYSANDSAFRLFKQPVVWAQENQITGDTIYLFTQNKKPLHLTVFENAMAISKVSEDNFNQLKGRIMNGFFVNGDINELRTKGNSESIYYMVDDNNKFVGINKASADVIDMFFADKKLNKVAFLYSVQGTAYPPKQAEEENKKLRGFNWQQERRPKTHYDIFTK